MPSSRISPLRTFVVHVLIYSLVVTSLPSSSTAFIISPSSVVSSPIVTLSSHQLLPSPLLQVVDVVTLSAADNIAATTPITSSIIPSYDYSSSVSPSSSDILLSLATLDPTTMLSDVLGGLLGSSVILAVPIIAALTIVAIIAALIVGYANPADED